MQSPAVRYLERDQIDDVLWNRCINDSANGLIYGTTVYQDAMADNWGGIVLGDYTGVMPLPWRKKWGIRYYYHPAFTQQLGVFGIADKAQYEAILTILLQKARYGDLMLNYSNAELAMIVDAVPRNNLVIDLSAGYSRIEELYKTDLLNYLKRSASLKLYYTADEDIRAVVHAFNEQYGKKISHLNSRDFERFAVLCETLKAGKMAMVRKVSDETGETLGMALFLKDSRRIYNMINITTESGRKKWVNHFLLDQVIQEFEGRELILDMEGSEIEGIKHFYQKFGAGIQEYFHYHHNKLPLPLKWLKR